jgi:hypothetical protein
MSNALLEVLARASIDRVFRAWLESDPQSALAGYELTTEEQAALTRRDANPSRELRVDTRISKQIDPPTTDTPWPEIPIVG